MSQGDIRGLTWRIPYSVTRLYPGQSGIESTAVDTANDEPPPH